MEHVIILCLNWKLSWPFPVTSAVAESASTHSDRHVDTGSGDCYSWSRFCNVTGGLGLSKNLLQSLSSPALIAGGAVGLLFAIFLILLLVYRMKKKDEGSYDLGKKPIYKKAPTNEFYA